MKKIRLENTFEGQVLRIILDSPKGNIVDLEMMQELYAVLDSNEEKRELKAVILEAEGKNFSFGASVEEHKKEQAAEMISNFHDLIMKISAFPLPVISKVSGLCLGGAFELVLATGRVCADESAKFGQPEINLSVFPPPASILLPLRTSFPIAEELLLTGRTMDASEARAAGLVAEIFSSSEEMENGVNEWVEKFILPKSAVALRFANTAVRMRINDILEEYLPELEEMYVQELMNTIDANEGIGSFLEKRRPVWQNI